jgi:hypothetical protein
MVAAAGDRWQAGVVRWLILASVLAAPGAITGATSVAGRADPAASVVAQGPAVAPEGPRAMIFTWTLYPKMWAEIDLRLAAGAEAVAEVTAQGGEVSWNLHVHPVEAPPATFVTLGQGVASRATLRYAPEVDGRYSYLFGNDGNAAAGPVRLRIELRLSGDARLEGVKP